MPGLGTMAANLAGGPSRRWLRDQHAEREPDTSDPGPDQGGPLCQRGYPERGHRVPLAVIEAAEGDLLQDELEGGGGGKGDERPDDPEDHAADDDGDHAD